MRDVPRVALGVKPGTVHAWWCLCAIAVPKCARSVVFWTLRICSELGKRSGLRSEVLSQSSLGDQPARCARRRPVATHRNDAGRLTSDPGLLESLRCAASRSSARSGRHNPASVVVIRVSAVLCNRRLNKVRLNRGISCMYRTTCTCQRAFSTLGQGELRASPRGRAASSLALSAPGVASGHHKAHEDATG